MFVSDSVTLGRRALCTSWVATSRVAASHVAVAVVEEAAENTGKRADRH
jgi:hypothetical protein